MRRRTIVGVVALVIAAITPLSAGAAKTKVALCHFDEVTQTFELITVSDKGNAITGHLAHGDGFPGQPVPGMAGFSFDSECGLNGVPVIDDQSFSVDENSPNGTPVGTIAFSDPDPGDVVTLSVSGGTGSTAFSVDGSSGDVTVADQAQLDFETTPAFTLDVLATDLDGASDSAVITINLNDVVECIATESDLRAAAAAGGDYCVEAAAPIVLTTGEVAVTTTLTLTSTGPGNAIIDANQTGRVFNVTGNLTLDDITVTGGRSPQIGGGGGVVVDGSTAALTLNGSTSITGNTAFFGGGVVVSAASGGGALTMNDTSGVSDNTSDGAGGVFVNQFGILTMNDSSTIARNVAEQPTGSPRGGGIIINVGTVVLNDNASIASNVVGASSPSCTVLCSNGGGVYFVNGGSLALTGSASITGNNSVGNGGGIFRIDGGIGTITGVTGTNVTGNSPNNCVSFGTAPPIPGCVG